MDSTRIALGPEEKPSIFSRLVDIEKDLPEAAQLRLYEMARKMAIVEMAKKDTVGAELADLVPGNDYTPEMLAKVIDEETHEHLK
jgi:hypothetical protein